MNFASDNVAEVAPEVMAAINAANEGAAIPYGADRYTDRLKATFAEAFETDEIWVYPVATGTAANAICMGVVAPSYGEILCLQGSHINEEECGAAEFYTGGAKLKTFPGANGKLLADELNGYLGASKASSAVPQSVASAISVTQLSEMGTLYSLDEVRAAGQIAGSHGLHLHMDGARFGQAVAALGCTPAEASWKAGVDILSFGATKNGTMGADAIVVFKEELTDSLEIRRKRGGHLFSKMRFVSAQLDAYVADGLWLSMAEHAVAMGQRLAAGLADIRSIEMLGPVDASMMFLTLPRAVADALTDAGFYFYQWGDPARPSIRLVTAFNTRVEDVDRFIEIARDQAKAA